MSGCTSQKTPSTQIFTAHEGDLMMTFGYRDLVLRPPTKATKSLFFGRPDTYYFVNSHSVQEEKESS
jgi:hypothetical protein